LLPPVQEFERSVFIITVQEKRKSWNWFCFFFRAIAFSKLSIFLIALALHPFPVKQERDTLPVAELL